MPRKHTKNIEISVRKILDNNFFWAYNSHFTGNWLEFSDLRNYVPWDSVKRIDWKTTAKNNEIFIKNFDQERDLKILFFLDFWVKMQFWSKTKKKIDTSIEIFYTLWLAAHKAWDAVGAYLYNWGVHKFFEYKKWEGHLEHISSSCEDFQNISLKKSDKNHFWLHIKNLEKLKITNALICICTDNTEFDTKILKGLNAKNQILFCNISDSFERNLWGENHHFHLRDQNSSFFWSLLDSKKQRKFRSIQKQKKDILKKLLLSSHIDYLEFDDNSHIYVCFLKYFQKWNK